jgi:hypothetical protein
MKPRHFISIIFYVTSFDILGAHAATRDDVLYGASRCEAIADDRMWLDCYYGAAQPMRAHLGLPPAPVSQQNLVPAGDISSIPPPQDQNQAVQPPSNPSPPKPGFFDWLWPF